MERLKELITQLKEQFDHKAEPAQLLEITRLVEAEIRLIASQPPAPARVMPTKIAVMMPSSAKIVAAPPQPAANNSSASNGTTNNNIAVSNGTTSTATSNGVTTQTPVTASAGAHATAPASVAAPVPVAVPTSVAAPASVVTPVSVAASATSPASAATQASVTSPASVAAAAAVPASIVSAPASIASAPLSNGSVTLKAPERGQWPFDPLAEKPTDRFTLSQKAREVNDVIGSSGSSLNDKLRTDVVDLKSTLNDSPVRDLRKAIGLNDRYVFINQLFRGDEVMYERSLKTINGFRILPEAEYWMERELKVKLGWDENRETTRHFYQLVKRRFS